MNASSEGRSALSTLAKSLETVAPGPILTLRCVSGHPVYIAPNDRVPSGDVQYDWTNTNLPLLEVGLPVTESTRQKCIAMLYTLEAHGLGLPLPAALETPYSDALKTCALIRGHDRFVQDSQVTYFLPSVPAPVRSLVEACNATVPSPLLTIHKGHRLAAVMIEANVFPILRTQIGGDLGILFPGIERTTSIIRTADPTIAANEIMHWIEMPVPNYSYRRDRGASAKRPRVHPLESVYGAVLSSTRTNQKEFNLELEHLRKQMHSQWKRPYIGWDHDRTIPPVAIVLNTHISSMEENGVEVYELHARLAGLDERGTKMLSTRRGLSVAFHEG